MTRAPPVRRLSRLARRARFGSLGSLLAAASLSGCATLLQRLPTPPPTPATADTSTAPKPGEPPSRTSAEAIAEAATTESSSYRLEVIAPPELATLLRLHLDLSRFQQATAADAITATELDRLVASSEAQGRELLRTQGYFAARVSTVREVRAPEDSTPPLVRVSVEPGPRASVSQWDLRAQGSLEADREQNDPRALSIWRDALAAWPLTTGEVFTQSAWDDAKTRVLARLRASGYPQASISGSSARVDAATQRVRLFAVLDSGPLVRLGLVEVQGLSRYAPSAVLNLVDHAPGTPYAEKRLLDLQERLAKVGLFDGVSVELESDPANVNAAVVQVTVREAPLQQATLSAGVSANTGPRIGLEHTHRRPFGLDWIARNKVQFGRDERNWDGSLLSHPWRGQYRALASGKLEWLDAGDAITQARQLRLGGSLDTERIERLFFLEALNDELSNAAGERSATAVSANYHMVWRDVDNVVLPTVGSTANMQAGLGRAVSSRLQLNATPGIDAETDRTGPFARAYGRFTLYRPVGKDWYFTGRLEVGQLFANTFVQVPETLQFRAGGDESVRGYAYRSLGPVTSGVVGSGRVVASTSVEMARPVLASVPSVWGAAFVDGGMAAEDWSTWKPVWGYGIGARWRSPVGPLRVDLAYGEAVKRVRLHVSVGIAF